MRWLIYIRFGLTGPDFIPSEKSSILKGKNVLLRIGEKQTGVSMQNANRNNKSAPCKRWRKMYQVYAVLLKGLKYSF